MKFVFVAPRYHTNQTGIVGALKRAGHKIQYHVNFKGKSEDHSLLTPVVWSNCSISKKLISKYGEGGGNKSYFFPNPILFYQTLKKEKPDFIVIRDPRRIFSLIAATCARLLSIKTIFYTQFPLHQRYSVRRKILASVYLRLFDATWYTPLQGDKSRFPQTPKNHFFIPFCLPRGPHKIFQDSTAVKVLMVAKYQKRKNHKLLISALSRIKANGLNFELLLVGECSSAQQMQIFEDIRDLVASTSLSTSTVYRNNIHPSEMNNIYLESDIFVLPATDEPASISVLEAMSFGLPVICSDSCGTRFYLEDNRSGLVFKSDDLEDLERCLVQLISDKRNIERMGECSARLALENLSSDNFLYHFNAMIEKKWNRSLI